MITEDYVSFEIAKLLKEKGFDVKCDKCYAYFADDDIRFLNLKYPKSSQLLIEDRYPCITLQMAKKWLREVHNIHIVVHPYTDKEGHHFSFLFDSYAYGCWQELGVYITDSWSTYEEACEAAIKYCLENLI